MEQTPQYTLHLDDMTRLFPGAQFLCLVRDGRDVVTRTVRVIEPVLASGRFHMTMRAYNGREVLREWDVHEGRHPTADRPRPRRTRRVPRPARWRATTSLSHPRRASGQAIFFT